MLIYANGKNRTWEWVLENADKITDVWLDNLSGITSVPEFPAATEVRLENLPGITSVPEFPAATEVWLWDLPGITSLPEEG